MSESNLGARGFLFIAATVYLSYILMLIPMDGWTAYVRPDWTMLVVLFWAQAYSSQVGLRFALLTGILLDVLLGQMLGTYALGLVVIFYLQLLLNQRYRVLSIFQQIIRVFCFSVLYFLIVRLLQSLLGDVLPMTWAYWLPILSNIIIWPWLYLLMEYFKSVFRLHEYNG